MLRDAYCSTIVFIMLIDGRLKLCSSLLPYKITIIGSLMSCPCLLREAVQVCMQGIQFILPSHHSECFVCPLQGKINGSADTMAAFHTQKRLGGMFITTLPFKNILRSNHISSTILPYGIHVINNLQGVSLTVLYGRIVCYCAYVTVTNYCVLTLAHSPIS